MEEAEMGRERECHPRLRGGDCDGGRKNVFSAAQMKSLSAMFEAFVPPVAPEELLCGGGRGDPPSKALRAFCMSSGSDPPFPEQIAELMTKRGDPLGLVLVRVASLALATRVGTLLLCGSLCLSWRRRWKLPSILRFYEMPLKERERVLMRWTRERYITPIRLVFLMVKAFCLFVFFSSTNEQSRNPSWDAIGYAPPPRPPPAPGGDRRRPLDDGLVDASTCIDSSLQSFLTHKGLQVTGDPSAGLLVVHCDVAIVGSGAGGGVAAAVLARSGHSVVVVEKGQYYSGEDFSSLEGPSMEELYDGGVFRSTADGGVGVLAGSVVGGGTAVNWSACLRTPEGVRREWEERGLEIFGRVEYEVALDAVWARLGITGACKEEGFQNQVLRRGCRRLGLEVVPVHRNSGEGHYCGHCGYGCPTGEKRGTEATWLVDAVQAGAVIVAGCEAERLLVASNTGRRRRCLGVLARSVSSTARGTALALEVRAKVTVCAGGALRTPRLLLASGLRNRNIGRNLRLHPVMLVWGHFPDPHCLRGNTFQGGIITSLHQVKPLDVIIEAPSLGPGTFACLTPWVSGLDMKERMTKYSRTAQLFALVRDRGSGTVDASGRITYVLHDADRESLAEGARRALRILLAAGATEVGTLRSDGQRLRCGSWAAEGEFLKAVVAPQGPMARDGVWGTYGSAHQMGTCRMGRSAEEGAVDGNGESWEVEGLFACDGSVLPTAVGVNPMVTIEATAYCIASRIVRFMEQGTFS